MTVIGARDYIKDVLEIRRDTASSEDEEAAKFGASRKGSGGGTGLGREAGQEEVSRDQTFSRALHINMVICNITIWVMFVVSVVELAFASLMQDDLKEDSSKYRSTCTSNYVFQDYGESYEDVSGKCDLLMAWTYVMIVGGSFCLVRTLMNALPVHGPNHLTIKYQAGGTIDNFLSPSRTYAIRTFFSGTALVLHAVSAVMLGVSPVIRDATPADEVYHLMYIVCLSIICASIILIAQQTYATGMASWRLRGRRKS